MNVDRVLAIAGRIIVQFRRDRRTMALLLIVPLVLMSVVGYLLSENQEPVLVAIVNADQGVTMPLVGQLEIGKKIETELGRQKTISLVSRASVSEAEAAVRKGAVLGAVALPSDLTQRLLSGRTVSIQVIVRGIDPATDRAVQMAVGKAMAQAVQKKQAAEATAPFPGMPASAGAKLPVDVKVKSLLASPTLSTMDYYAPALIVAFSFFVTFLLTSVSFLRERSSGTMERLGASPATQLEVMLGYLLGFLVFSLLQALIVLGYAVWVLGVHVGGSIWLVLLVLAVLVIGTVNLGITLSFFARNELQVIQFIPLVFVPQLFLAGLIGPVAMLHPVFRAIAQAMPLTHAVAALREVMLAGGDFRAIQGRFYALVGFALAMILLGVAALRKQRA